MSGYRFEARALLDPTSLERVVGGELRQLVTLELCDGSWVVDDLGRPAGEPPVRCDVRPAEARELAFELLRAAERAERTGARR